MKNWLIGTSIFAVLGVLAIGCTVEEGDDDDGTGGKTTGGAKTGGVEQGGDPATGGRATGGTNQGGDPATGGTSNGGEAGSGTGGGTCYDGTTHGELLGYDDCADWSEQIFVTTTCSDGNPPYAMQQCEYYVRAARDEVFTELLDCFEEYAGTSDCSDEAEAFMNDCVDDVGAFACSTEEAEDLCPNVNSDCPAIAENPDKGTEYCGTQVNVVIQSERDCIAECWAEFSADPGSDWDSFCEEDFETCLSGCAVD